MKSHFLRHPQGAAPAGVPLRMQHWRLATLTCGGGVHLRYATYPAMENQPSQWLVFLGGRNEFLEKYAALPRDLALPSRCSFLSWDHRGHGASSGVRCHIDSYETYARDAQRIIDHHIGVDTPYTIIAHSMGALIALYAAMKHYIRPHKLILSSPLLGIPNRPLPRLISRPLSCVLAKIGMAATYIDQKKYPREDFAHNHLTHDPEKYRFLKEGPYPGHSVTIGWLHASFQALSFVHSPEGLSQLEAPVYILSAEDEQVVDPLGTERFVARARSLSSQRIIHEKIPKARHELLYEEAELYRQTLSKVSSWLNLWPGGTDMSGT